MVSHSRAGTFSPNPALQTAHSGINHSPHPSQAGGSPSTSSPTAGTSSLTKIVVAQVYLLLSTIRDDKDEKWEQLRKLIDDNGMEVFSRYFTRLVAGNAPKIFGISRPVANAGTEHLLVAEMRKIAKDRAQARMIAESIETGNEDIFRDFDLSTFMEHFRLDALEKTILALAFKLGSRPDLRTKADAILAINFPTFVNMLHRPDGEHADMSPDFIAEIIDRFIQLHPPNFTAAAKSELRHNVGARYAELDQAPPSQVLAALDLMRVLGDRPPNALALYIHRTGPQFTSDEQACISHLENRPKSGQLNEEQVSAALTYTTISQTQHHNPSVLVAALRRILPDTFRWQDVVTYFDQRDVRISSNQFLRLYNALLPIAKEDSAGFGLDIQRLWGGEWEHPETQLSFVCAFASLSPDQLDASTIPGLKPTFTLDSYVRATPSVRERAAYAVRHPLVSVHALSAVFNVALHSIHASQSIEAKRLFQEVVVPNLDIFVVSAFGVSRPWPAMAVDTLNSLFEEFLYKKAAEYDFVLESLWSKDKDWVKGRLIDAHASKPLELPLILEHAVKHGWLDELVYIPNGFGMDLTALAHADGLLDLQKWSRRNAELGDDYATLLLRFLDHKARCELAFQRGTDGQIPQTSLHVRTVYSLLTMLEELLPKTPIPSLIAVQRQCITAYPRLINYGEGFDDLVDANSRAGNALPLAAIAKMEEHYKKMYSVEIQVRDIVAVLERYKKSRDPLDQDVFACMIHGLFDEYSHYIDYPLEALATTAVLFGGIISHKLVSDLPLKIGLGMILEAVRDHAPNESMYKFGLQALMQLFSRLREWPGFCKQLTQIPGLEGTEARNKAEEVVQKHEEEQARSLRNGGGGDFGFISQLGNNDHVPNGKVDGAGSETHPPPFRSINVDPPPLGNVFEEPGDDAQGKIQFVLNNLTETTLQSMFRELREMLEDKHQQWFASHLVEERAKMQPNYHTVYLELVEQFGDKSLWAEILRETYISVSRMLNSEMTMQNSTERTHLKNLGDWLGRLTLARDKPIKHKNIAFKELLIEAHDMDRLIVVIPFVCRVLSQGAASNVFQPPNPWLMDIIHLLIELYHNATLKLNQKFEIEVLCKNLHLDHKSIEPSGEILNRIPVEEVVDIATQDALELFENMSLNGLASGVPNAHSPHAAPPPIPDLGPNLQIPQTEVVSASRLHEIVRNALTRALQDIIQPVVDRSVTIAAIATAQMIHKDFCTEPDENRLRTSAINMVKSTAGSLALVTSKEPLRANFTNYLRNLSNELPQGLPEGVIIMCVNSNLDLASKVIETSAEERAVPEIEELIREEMEVRRQHRLQHPDEPFYDRTLSRWAWTIPNPYKLTPNAVGLNAEQMAIYEDFARQPRSALVTSTPSHVPSSSDATRSLANEVLQDQYSSVPNIPTPAETPSLPILAAQMQHYPQVQTGMTNGRQAGLNQIDGRVLADRVGKLLEELQLRAANAQEEHFKDLPRPHPVLDIYDAIVQLIIKTHASSEDFVMFAAREIIRFLLTQAEGDSLVLDTLVHVLDTIRNIVGPLMSAKIRLLFQEQPGHLVLQAPLIAALLGTDLLDWRNLDDAMATLLQQRKPGSIDFFEHLLDITILNAKPLAMYSDFIHSLEEAWAWIAEEPDVDGGRRFKAKLLAPPPDLSATMSPEQVQITQLEQMDYVFDEWVLLCNNPRASDKAPSMFVEQLASRRILTGKETLFVFIRRALDRSVDRFDDLMMKAGPSAIATAEGYQAVDALVKMIVILLLEQKSERGGQSSQAGFLDSIVAFVVMVLNHHQATRSMAFNQKVFFRFFSVLLHEISDNTAQLTEVDQSAILLMFADRLVDMGPARFPGFLYQWIGLIQHRILMPALLKMRDNAGWGSYLKLMRILLEHLGDQAKILDASPITKDVYRAVIKLFIVLTHDFPEFVVANHIELCKSTFHPCAQLLNLILFAIPESMTKMPDPLEPGLNLEALSELGETPAGSDDQSDYLRQAGLLDLLDRSLERGPSEDAIAQITHAINTPDGRNTTFGFMPVKANLKLIYAVTTHIGAFAVKRAGAQGHSSTSFVAGSSDIKTLMMLVLESAPEARYFLLSSMVNQLRFPNSYTIYFSQALVDIFGHDLSDPDEEEIREQIIRILLERLASFWAHPWGLLHTIIELVRSDKYSFFDLPSIKSAPMISDRFAAVLQRPQQ